MKIHPAKFQFVVSARVKKGTRPKRTEIKEIVEHWIDGTEEPPEGWSIKVIIWDGAKTRREVNEIDDSPRGEILRSILRRGLRGASFRVNTLGRG
jgi:hypothetical protein